MDNKKVDINAYFLNYLMENKVLFAMYCLLLGKCEMVAGDLCVYSNPFRGVA